MRAIPDDTTGYAVDARRGIVHRRYAADAIGLPRTRSLMGALSMGRDLSPCDTCYPPPPPVKAKRKPELKPVPVEVEVMAPDDVDAFSLRGPEVPTFGPTVESED